MEDIKLTITQEKREETIDKILELIEKEFKGIDITAIFTKKLLEDTIKILENKCMETELRFINK
jgi:cobalamin biosynthesis Co2+ chelatase CbiK